MTNTIKSSLNEVYSILSSYIKYNPLNNFQWSVRAGKGLHFHNLFNTITPLVPFLPSKLGQGINLSLSLIEIIRIPFPPSLGALVASYFEPKFGLGIHTARAFVENLLNSQTSTLEKTGRLLSNVLTFASLFKLSKRDALIVSLSQSLLQAVLSFYASYKVSQGIKEDKWKILPAVSQAIAGALFLSQAYGCFQTIQKMQKIVNQVFILMRHADRERNGDASQIIEPGYERSKEAAKIIEGLQQKYGKENISLIASRLIRSKQTAEKIAESLGVQSPDIDQKIHERANYSKLNAEERRLHPQYIEYKSSPTTKQFYLQPIPGQESGFEQYERMEQATYEFLNRLNPDQLGVAVTHSLALSSLMKGLKIDGHDIPDAFVKGTKFCEMLILKVKSNYMLQGLERIRVELPAK